MGKLPLGSQFSFFLIGALIRPEKHIAFAHFKADTVEASCDCRYVSAYKYEDEDWEKWYLQGDWEDGDAEVWSTCSQPATGDSLKLCVSHSEPISLYLFCTLVSHYKGKPTVFYHSIPFELFGIRRSTRLPYLIMLQKLKQNTEKGIMVREPTEITVRSYLEPDDKKKRKNPTKAPGKTSWLHTHYHAAQWQQKCLFTF